MNFLHQVPKVMGGGTDQTGVPLRWHCQARRVLRLVRLLYAYPASDFSTSDSTYFPGVTGCEVGPRGQALREITAEAA